MADFWYRVSLKLVPRLFVGLTRIWFGTCRVRVTGKEHRAAVLAGGPAIAVFWHYSFAYLLYHLRKYKSAVMVSASRDGEYIAEVARCIGHVPLRGSSNRFGTKALRAMIKAVGQGHNAGIVADGSQGPARKAQGGCILLAAKTGSPIIPLVWAANRYIAFRSWDRTAIPLPFSTIAVHYGHPLTIPEKINGQKLEEYRQQLEQQLNNLYTKAWQEVGRSPHDAT